MPRIEKTVLVHHSAAQMFSLVEKVEDYPKFLPWCHASHVVERSDHSMQASITLDFKAVRHTFTTANLHDPPHRIDMRLVDGPFRSLMGYWEFKPLGNHGCKISFFLAYEFSNRLLEKMIGPVFGMIANGLVDSFVRRAERVYG